MKRTKKKTVSSRKRKSRPSVGGGGPASHAGAVYVDGVTASATSDAEGESEQLGRARELVARALTDVTVQGRAAGLAARVMSLHLNFGKLVELLKNYPDNRLGDMMAARSGVAVVVERVWLAFHGLGDERHKRLALVGAIEEAHLVGGRRGGGDELAVPADFDRARFAVAQFALFYPELARGLDREQVAIAIGVWNRPAGRPPRGVSSKWSVINQIAVAIGLPHVEPRSIQRDWERYGAALKDPFGLSALGN